MLYPTLSQPLGFLVIALTGLMSGALFDLFGFLAFASGNDKHSKIFFDFLATIFSFVLLFLVNLQVNYGQFRLFVLLAFFLGFVLQRFLSKILWTKCVKKWYNSFKEIRLARKKLKKEK